MNVLVTLFLASQTGAALGRLDLNRTLLTVAASKTFPYCDFSHGLTSEDESIFRPSFELNYLKILKEKFNFRVKLLDMGHDFGIKINGTWDGLLGAVSNRKADIGMCILSITYERSEAVDFSFYTLMDGINLISYAPGPKKQDWIISIPFTNIVWTLIGISLLVLSLIQYFHYQVLGHPKALVELVLQHFAISTRQSIVLKRDLVSKLSFFLWIVTMLILTTGYLSVLHTILTLSEYEEPLETQEQLITALVSDKVIPRIQDKTFIQTYTDLAQANGSKIYFEIKQNMARNKVNFITTLKHYLEEALQWSRSIPPVFFSSEHFSNLIRSLLEKEVDLYVSKEYIFYSYLALALPKKSRLLPHFNKVIQRLVEGGFAEHWIGIIERYYSRRFKQNRVGFVKRYFGVILHELTASGETTTRAKLDDNRKLSLSDFRSVFQSLSIGLSLSFIVFVIEMFVVWC